QQLGVDRRDLRQHRLGLLAPAQVTAHHPGQGRRHVPRPAPAGRARDEIGIRAVRLAVRAPAARPAAPADLLGQGTGQHLLDIAEPGRRRSATGQQLADGQALKIVLVCIHHTRECREQESRSTTTQGTSKRVEPGQPFSRQPASQWRLTPVSPRLRQRDLAADTARAYEHRVRPAALHIQDLKPLPVQRMKRMSDNHETRKVTGQRGTMPPPWALRESGYPVHAISVFPPPSPEAGNRSPTTSGSRSYTDCSSDRIRSPRAPPRQPPARPYWPSPSDRPPAPPISRYR